MMLLYLITCGGSKFAPFCQFFLFCEINIQQKDILGEIAHLLQLK